MTGLVEKVSRADAPSTIVGRSRIEIPALAADTNSDNAAGLPGCRAAGLPVNVAVPADALKGIRRLNLRIHLPAGSPDTEVGQESDQRELPAHVADGGPQLGSADHDQFGAPTSRLTAASGIGSQAGRLRLS